MFPSPAPHRDVAHVHSGASFEEPWATARWEDTLAIVSAVPGSPNSIKIPAPKPVGIKRDLCRNADKPAQARFARQADPSVPSLRAVAATTHERHATHKVFKEKTNSHCAWDTSDCPPAPSAKTEPTDYSVNLLLQADENTEPFATRGAALSTGQRPSRFGNLSQSAHAPPPTQPQHASRSVLEVPSHNGSRRARCPNNQAASTSPLSRMRSDDPPAPRRPRHSHMERWERGLPQESLSRHTPHPAAGMPSEWQKACKAARARQMKMDTPI